MTKTKPFIGFRVDVLTEGYTIASQRWDHADAKIRACLSLEQVLREAAGQPVHETSFIAHWLSRLLFYRAPAWVFVAVYTAFTALVALSWWRWPPRPRRGAHAPAP